MTHLKQWVASDNTQEAFQAFPSRLDHLVRESVGEDLARERGDVHAGRLALKNIAESFKVAVAPSNGGMS